MPLTRIRALVVGDRFIGADLFASALEAAADQAGAAPHHRATPARLPRGRCRSAANDWPPPRHLGRSGKILQEAAARAAADLSADPTIREYTGPVDLLVRRTLAGVEAVAVHLAPVSRTAVDAADSAAGDRLRSRRRGQPEPGKPQQARHSRLLLPGPQCPGGRRIRHGRGAGA